MTSIVSNYNTSTISEVERSRSVPHYDSLEAAKAAAFDEFMTISLEHKYTGQQGGGNAIQGYVYWISKKDVPQLPDYSTNGTPSALEKAKAAAWDKLQSTFKEQQIKSDFSPDLVFSHYHADYFIHDWGLQTFLDAIKREERKLESSFKTISLETSSSTISLGNISYSNGVDLSKLSKEETMRFFEEVGVFQAGLYMLNHMYSAQSRLTNTIFADMNEASKSSVEAQTMVGKMEAVIAELQGKDDKNAKIKLPEDVINYIKNPANNFDITINLHKEMKLSELQDIKSVLSSKSNTLTTEVNNNQLALQQMMNTINLLTSVRSDIQTLQYRTISAISIGK